jgi:hypothetical protein
MCGKMRIENFSLKSHKHREDNIEMVIKIMVLLYVVLGRIYLL